MVLRTWGHEEGGANASRRVGIVSTVSEVSSLQTDVYPATGGRQVNKVTARLK